MGRGCAKRRTGAHLETQNVLIFRRIAKWTGTIGRACRGCITKADRWAQARFVPPLYSVFLISFHSFAVFALRGISLLGGSGRITASMRR